MPATKYCSVEELKERMEKTDDTDDATLFGILRAAERKIDQFCNRPDGFVADTTASARYYPGSGLAYQWIDECVEVSAVAVKDSPTDDTYEAWTAPSTNMAGDGDYFAGSGPPDSPNFNRLPYTLLFVDPNGDQTWFTGETYAMRKRGRAQRGINLWSHVPTVKVTAKWGYSASVPLDIKEAAGMQAARWYKRLQGAMADALASADLGGLFYQQQLDPDIRGILVDGRYVRIAATGRR
jgi:hypothetical protein